MKFQKEMVCGRELFTPIDKKAKAITKILKQKSLSRQQLNELQKEGHHVEVFGLVFKKIENFFTT